MGVKLGMAVGQPFSWSFCDVEDFVHIGFSYAIGG